MSSPDKLSCFVIMPFGEKPDTDGRLINFDVIYKFIIDAAVKELKEPEGLEIEVTRCDDIEKAGSIDVDMFNGILKSDIAVVDITTGNANVFYELGMRHTIRKNVTIIIRRNTERIPFNIRGLRAISYDPSDVSSFDKTKKAIKSYIVSGLRAKNTDSPIREALPDLKVSFPLPTLPSGTRYVYPLAKDGATSIGVVTGDLEELRDKASIWVSSENTDMQLARFHDRSVSGLVRYLGADKEAGVIVKDCIGKEIADTVTTRPVSPGTIIATDSGALKNTHQVERIYHAATVQGTPGHGYSAVPNVTTCIGAALDTADAENKKRGEERLEPLDSILFPVFGTGVAKGSYRDNAKALINAALNHIENNGSSLSKVLFMALNRNELIACLDVLDQFARAKRLKKRVVLKN